MDTKGQEMRVEEPELDRSLGRRSQIGGGLAAFIGVLLLVFTPAAPLGTPVWI